MKTVGLRSLALLAIGMAASGFGPGGCSFLSDPCAELDEQECRATPGCSAEYCACPMCVPGPGCPPCTCEGDGYQGCQEVPPEPPPPPIPPARSCSELGEDLCVRREGCRPVYEALPCLCGEGCEEQVFVRCEPAGCPEVTCDLYCPRGFVRDEGGCEVCSCQEGCTSDAECAPGEYCVAPPPVGCPPGQRCFGTCEPLPATCSSNADCREGEWCNKPVPVCSPDSACPDLRGRCEAIPEGWCNSAADCAPGQVCELVASCTALGCWQPALGQCRAASCENGESCPPGEVCMPDPRHPCAPGDYCAAPMVCLPTCEGLSPEDCRSRPDCRAEYKPTMDLPVEDSFRCVPATPCPAVDCDLWCPFGYQVDANGCQLCACRPDEVGCFTDEECAPGQRCVFETDGDSYCPPGVWCMPPSGLCMPAGCHSDSECAEGEVCLLPLVNCPMDANCPADGVCAPKGACNSDRDCDPGASCIFLMDCVTMDPYCWGHCAELACRSDGECGPGMVCEPGPDCQTGMHCVPGCHADSDCGPGMACRQTQYCKTCPCPAQCVPVEGECASDRDCGPGRVCEPGFEGGLLCVPGCRSDADCAPDSACTQVTCAVAPCPPMCLPKPGCASDAECAPGTVCEPRWDGTRSCVAGCRTDADCGPAAACEPLVCVTMPCPAQCQPKPQPECNTDADCVAGDRCVIDLVGDAFRPVCRPAVCQGDGDCAPGEQCLTCPPNAFCFVSGVCAAANGCLWEGDCAEGQQCVLPVGCSGPLCRGTCEASPGCRSDADCRLGQRCEQVDCLSTDCAAGARCVDVPCRSKEECPPGSVCAPNTTSSAGLVCQPPCAGLDEPTCNVRWDCRAVYGPSACSGEVCTADWVFLRCE